MADSRELTRRRNAEPTREAREDYRIPPVDIYETPDSLVLMADMPGVGEQGIEVSVEEDTLSIVGRVNTPQPASAAALHTEFEPAPFRRAFTLSRDLKRDAIEGKIQNGVLRITLAKAEEAKVRKIPIKTE